MSYRHESCVLGRPADSCPLRGYCDCRYDAPRDEAQAPARRPPRERRRHSREDVRAAASRARERARRRVDRWSTWARCRNPCDHAHTGYEETHRLRAIHELTSDRVPRRETPPRRWASDTLSLRPSERRLREWDAADTADAMGPAGEQPEHVWRRDDDDYYAELHAVVAGTYPVLYDTDDARSRG